MKEIIFGTKNKAKIDQIQATLKPLDIQVKGIGDFTNLPEVLEDGKTAQENASKKAVTYAKALGKTVLSMDNALYLDGLPDNLQPGINVRRIPGSSDRPTDEDLQEYYSSLIAKYGGEVTGYFEYCIAIAKADGEVIEAAIKAPRRFVSKVSPKTIPGYPLESLQIYEQTGKYVSEMSEEAQASYWQSTIGTKIQKLFAQTDL